MTLQFFVNNLLESSFQYTNKKLIQITMVAKTFNIKGQKNYDDVFPFSVRSCAGLDNLNSLIDWIENHRDHILEKTDNHGAFLIRGVSIDNEHDFERVIKTFRLECFNYRFFHGLLSTNFRGFRFT